jgi:hypothetical protein
LKYLLVMNKLIKIINEEISAIAKDKDKEIFDYHSIIEDAWDEPKRTAQDFQKIHFDFENDDSTGQKKTFYLKKNLRKDQPVKYEINAELFTAGGDWEMPVLYFRLEFTHDYGIMKSDDWKKSHKPEYVWDLPKDIGGLYHNFVIIPPVEAGNKLIKGDTKDKAEWYAYHNSEMSEEEQKRVSLSDADKLNSWKWLKELFEKLINERHEMLDE